MNGYMRAVQRILPGDPVAAAPSQNAGRVVSLQQWMGTCMRRRDEAPSHAPSSMPVAQNVAEWPKEDSIPNAGRSDTCSGFANGLQTFDNAVSFVLGVIFNNARTKEEIRIARAMFRPSASIVLIPRDRPTSATAVSVDEFFSMQPQVLKYAEGWEEASRLHDSCVGSPMRVLVRARILLDPGVTASQARYLEVVFALRSVSAAQRIHSCTIVYDEQRQVRPAIAACR